ncbi:50S ribosomal protein L6 [Candidatus Microgenomates bacterium]|nr:50S ribosomal protein L6 [Candidatus Microgenomates bacterium]
MSRIGKLPVLIPGGVTVTIDKRTVSASGGKGSLDLQLPRGVQVEQVGASLVVKPVASHAAAAERWGMVRTLLANLLQGVSEGFTKQLEIQGVGYRAQLAGDKLTLNLGYSHPIEYTLPAGIEARVEANVLTVSGVSKEQVGQVAAELRGLRPPEPYKGKGLRYVGEHVRRKAGKTAGKAAG